MNKVSQRTLDMLANKPDSIYKRFVFFCGASTNAVKMLGIDRDASVDLLSGKIQLTAEQEHKIEELSGGKIKAMLLKNEIVKCHKQGRYEFYRDGAIRVSYDYMPVYGI